MKVEENKKNLHAKMRFSGCRQSGI